VSGVRRLILTEVCTFGAIIPSLSRVASRPSWVLRILWYVQRGLDRKVGEKLGLSIESILLKKRVYLSFIIVNIWIARILHRHFLLWIVWVHEQGRQELVFLPGKCTRILEQVTRSYVGIPLCEGAVGWMARGVQLAIR